MTLANANLKPGSYSLTFEIQGLPKLPNTLLGAPWRIRASHAKKWKRSVWRCAWAFKPAQPLASAVLCLTRVSSVRPDHDGLVGGFKPIIDGLVECGVLSNDTYEVIGTPKYEWEKGKRGAGKIKVKVEEI